MVTGGWIIDQPSAIGKDKPAHSCEATIADSQTRCEF
jgi:hypothetical protein